MVLNVAVGIIKNQFGEILISQRAKEAHQGGLWEFPGGKLEPGENTYQALKRELFEELGITIFMLLMLSKADRRVWKCSQLNGCQFQI